MTDPIRLALPSKGNLAESTQRFLARCGLPVNNPNPRQYVGEIASLPDVQVVFQRTKDVLYTVADGKAHLGITGLDVIHEHAYDDPRVCIIHDALAYGACRLLIAVPEAWLDVDSLLDLADVALDLRAHKNHNLRVATTFTNSARRFLHAHDIHHFTLVKADGAVEVAPTLGYADAIVDLVQTGTTLRENRLKALNDGIIVTSQACLIGNYQALLDNRSLLSVTKIMLEYIDAALAGDKHYQLSVTIRDNSVSDIPATLMAHFDAKHPHGSLTSQVTVDSHPHETWHSATVVVPKDQMLHAVEYLRTLGGTHIIAQPVSFIFLNQSSTFDKLKQRLHRPE